MKIDRLVHWSAGEALVESGHRVVFLENGRPGELNRESVVGVDIIKTIVWRGPRTAWPSTCSISAIACVMLLLHPLAYPLRHRMIDTKIMLVSWCLQSSCHVCWAARGSMTCKT